MADEHLKSGPHTGGCLCGAVKYEVHGELRDVVNCHCSKCRRVHGNYAAYSSARREDLRIIEDRGLRWYDSVQDETPDVKRGFCSQCGSSLFWDAKERPTMAIAAGSLDQPADLKTVANIWVEQKGSYYELSDDLPQHPRGYNQPVEKD